MTLASALSLLAPLAPTARAHAQACCGRMDLPLSSTQRTGSRAGELVAGVAYEYALSRDGIVSELLEVKRVHTHRLALDVGYGATAWLTPNLTLPFAAKLTEERIGSMDETRSTFGLGDMLALIKVTLVGADEYAPGALRLWLAPGVKLPTGPYRADDEFGRIPPPAQLGTGSWDALASAFASIGLTGEDGKLLLLGQLTARLTTANPEQYRFGHTFDAGLALQGPVSEAFALRAGPALAWAARDEYQEIPVGNSGGLTLAGRGGVAWAFAQDMSLGLDLEVPVLRAVNGDQLDPVFRGSLGWLVGWSP